VNTGSAQGNSSANSGPQSNTLTTGGQCASNGVNIGDLNTGVVNNGNGNKVNNNSGEVLGVLIQNLGGKGGGKGAEGRGKGGGGGNTTTINAVQNLGNTNGQAAVGGAKKGSTPNQNSTQTFISQ
jgi:hypothetical protein